MTNRCPMEEMIPEKADFDQHTWGRCHGKAGEENF
jgi:hypothetical protein